MPYNGSITEALQLVYPNIVTKSSYSYYYSNAFPTYWNGVSSGYSSSNASFVAYNWTASDATAVAASTKAAASGALSAFHNVAKVSFTTGTSTASDIVISETSKQLYTWDANHINLVPVSGITASPPVTGATTVQKQQASDAFILPSAHSSADWLTRVMQHELSHSIGLQDADKSSVAISTLAKNMAFTVMSYNKHPGENTFATELQLYDIAALQSIYGRADTYAATDTVYNSFAETTGNRVGHDRMFSIWDGGGNDTIDASSLATAALIDLRPGHFSSIGPDSTTSITAPTTATGTPTVTNEGKLNVSIAFGAYIENATGTSSADLLIGNAYTNHLVGGGGNDVIYGEGYGSSYNPGDGDYSRVTNTGSKITAVSVDPNNQYDVIDGGAGNDFLVGSRGADTINGGDGNDIIIGNGGMNTLNGGAGDDTLYGYNPQQLEYGGVSFTGGAGNDTFYVSGGGNGIADLDSGDTVFLHGLQLHGGLLSNVPESNQFYDGTYTYAWNQANSFVHVSSTSGYDVYINDFQNGEAGIYLDNTQYWDFGRSSLADLDEQDNFKENAADWRADRWDKRTGKLYLADRISAPVADWKSVGAFTNSSASVERSASLLAQAISTFDSSTSGELDYLAQDTATNDAWLVNGNGGMNSRIAALLTV